MASGAQELIERLKAEGGAYPGWSKDIRERVVRLMGGVAPQMAANMAGLFGPGFKPTADEFRTGWQDMYGIGAGTSPDGISSLFELLKAHVPASEALRAAYAGLVPQLTEVDLLTDEVKPLRVASAFVVRADDGTHAVILTTQFSKVVSDFSTIISSTGPEADFKISPTDILDGLAALVRLRWVNCETPPTWKMNWMPENLFADREWMLRNTLTQAAIKLFVLSHEAGHIELGHLNNGAEQYRVGSVDVDIQRKRAEQELAADVYAARSIATLLSELSHDAPEELVLYGAVNLCKFLHFSDILAESAPGPDIHPPGSRRAEVVLRELTSAGLLSGKSLAQLALPLAAAEGFFNSVRRRLRA